jgi:SAM-dependent methyltransferase
MTVIDLGCGLRKVEGAVGVDVRALPGVDVVADLSRIPYPFANASTDVIHLNHVLEHSSHPVAVLSEIWRIGRNGSTVSIRVPHYTGRFAWVDPTHQRCFTSESFNYFGSNSYSYYTEARFNVRRLRLKYFMERPRRWIYRLWGALVQTVLDRHPTFSERFLAYLVGGIDEIQVTLEVVK